jgi:hypothetical protein
MYKGVLVRAEQIINETKNKKVYKIPYNGELLYNVLLEKNGLMIANGIISETLNTKNIIAKTYGNKKITKILNNHIHDPDYLNIAKKLIG